MEKYKIEILSQKSMLRTQISSSLHQHAFIDDLEYRSNTVFSFNSLVHATFNMKWKIIVCEKWVSMTFDDAFAHTPSILLSNRNIALFHCKFNLLLWLTHILIQQTRPSLNSPRAFVFNKNVHWLHTHNNVIQIDNGFASLIRWSIYTFMWRSRSHRPRDGYACVVCSPVPFHHRLKPIETCDYGVPKWMRNG